MAQDTGGLSARCVRLGRGGTRGDSFDNALAETIIGLYKTELIRRRGPWKGIDDVEDATLEWVDWFNHRRLLEPIGYLRPADFEAAFQSEEDPATLLDASNRVSDQPGAVHFSVSLARGWSRAQTVSMVRLE